MQILLNELTAAKAVLENKDAEITKLLANDHDKKLKFGGWGRVKVIYQVGSIFAVNFDPNFVIKVMDGSYRVMIEWCKSLQLFLNLEQNDQIALIKGCSCMIF